MNLLRLAIILLGFATSASAIPFTLDSSTATVVNGSTNSAFFEVTGGGVESGPGAALYNAVISGTASVSAGNPFRVEIFFGANPQPVLTSAFIKAGNQYLWWDAADLAAFNAGSFTSIILIQNGLLNNPGTAYNEIAHAGLNGSPGIDVPDGGSTLVLAGLALSLLGVVSRRRGA